MAETFKLTKTAVDAAQPKGDRYRLNDSLVPGLCVLVLPSGQKTYYLRHRTADGRQRDLKLGTPAELVPDDARRLARQALAQVREGRDPQAERQKLLKAPTVADLAAAYMERHGKRKRSSQNDDGYWRLHLVPKLGPIKVVVLSPEHVRNFHASHPKPITANRCLEVLSKAMELAIEWGWRSPGTNPCAGIEAHPERKRRRYMKAQELERLRDALVLWEVQGGTGSFRWRFAQLVRLLLLTGARLREVMEARWDWVDWERAEIIVPPEFHKTGEESGETRCIALSDRAVEILRRLRQAQNYPSPWLLQGEKQGRPMVGYRRPWLALLRDAEIGDLRIHDLRHTFASYTLSGGETLGVVGQLLGHRSTQTTARYAHLVDDAARRAVRQVSDTIAV